MPAPAYRRAIVAAAVAGVGALVVGPAASATMIEKPHFQMPFACGEKWLGSTRSYHSPSPYAIDWTRNSADLGHIVTASAPGVVATVQNLGDTSYGLYVVVDNGRGWSNLDAHLLRSFVTVGERVDEGQPIGLLGDSGNATGPHLHYEQRLRSTDQAAAFDGSSFAYNTWLESRNCVDVPISGNWNGDRASDVGVFRRHAGKGLFLLRLPSGTVHSTRFGAPTDTPVVGDWNGDGRTDIGVWRARTATFRLLTANGGTRTVAFGDRRDVPVTGDWDGNGRWNVGVFDPATATFLLRYPHRTVKKQFGTRSSIPVTGDWNGDGRTDVGVYNPARTRFSLALPGGGTKTVVYGTRTSLPVIGDWNGDHVSDLGVWDTATGVFSKRLTAKRTTSVRFGHIR